MRSSQALVVAFLFFSPPAIAQVSATFTGIGVLYGPPVAIRSSDGLGISADGATLVGQGASTFFGDSSNVAIRWTAATGIAVLGFLPGGYSSTATAANLDGSVVVGMSTFSDPQPSAGAQTSYFTHRPPDTQAFRWTQAEGMVGLGFLSSQRGSSAALGVSADGSIIVGSSTDNLGYTEAFRWTQNAGMKGLGFLTSSSLYSNAEATNGDGSVIVGESRDFPSNRTQAFRWTQAAGLVGLGYLNDAAGYSLAHAVSASGRVVVGESRNSSGNLEAFRWTAQSGMVGLGILGAIGGYPSAEEVSVAYGVSSNGGVIVGQSTTSNNIEAFRWTAKTGMRTLSGLLKAAGVNLQNFANLNYALGISADGQFIVGTAQLYSGYEQAFIARYTPGTTTTDGQSSTKGEQPGTAGASADPTEPSSMNEQPGVAGLTTTTAVQSSADELARSHARVLIQQHAFAAPLLGAALPIGVNTEAGLFASAGSSSAGGFGRIAIGNGISILGGIAYEQEQYHNASVPDVVVGAIATRYVLPSLSYLSPFVELGGWLAPGATLQFRRPYENGSGLAFGTGNTSGWLSYGYGRSGVAIHPWDQTELAISGEVGGEVFRVDGYQEPLLQTNPFNAVVSGSTDRLLVKKLRVQLTQTFAAIVDASVYVVGAEADRPAQVAMYVAGLGAITGQSDRPRWLEYGGRVGLRLSPRAVVDAFANGISDNQRARVTVDRTGSELRVHVGAALRVQF